MRLLYVVRDPYPTNRPDIVTLFGEGLSARGIASDIVALRHGELADRPAHWPGGAEHVCTPGAGALGRALGGLRNDLRALRRCRDYDGVVVRDKILTAAIALLMRGPAPVFYWASFPMAEHDLARAAMPLGGWLRRQALRARGALSAWLLYRWVVPRAARVFVQSDGMAQVFAARSGRTAGLVAVPMGVNPSELRGVPPTRRALPDGAPFTMMYLGSMDRDRRIDFLLDVLVALRAHAPAVDWRLRLVGGANTEPEFAWLQARVHALGLDACVTMTGPVPRARAWALAADCQVGLSAIPRGPVYDVSSPTKVLEYLAIGLPVLVNDIPDQAHVVARTGGGLCRPMHVDDFVDGVLALRADFDRYAARAHAARGWLLAERGYDVLADHVAAVLKEATDCRER